MLGWEKSQVVDGTGRDQGQERTGLALDKAGGDWSEIKDCWRLRLWLRGSSSDTRNRYRRYKSRALRPLRPDRSMQGLVISGLRGWLRRMQKWASIAMRRKVDTVRR
uniref:WGS project CBMG000000000 data, contig CS5907-c002284 n=1 Tax=Fusarium acuminatum CS5907 TaxID=1318461 RepID=A0A090MDN3_9HYPO|nr:unnamed protein product [Fusarium acuminatum CS5907]